MQLVLGSRRFDDSTTQWWDIGQKIPKNLNVLIGGLPDLNKVSLLKSLTVSSLIISILRGNWDLVAQTPFKQQKFNHSAWFVHVVEISWDMSDRISSQSRFTGFSKSCDFADWFWASDRSHPDQNPIAPTFYFALNSCRPFVGLCWDTLCRTLRLRQSR
jgi:hypothetical protein